jgi:hypothetical protein
MENTVDKSTTFYGPYLASKNGYAVIVVPGGMDTIHLWQSQIVDILWVLNNFSEQISADGHDLAASQGLLYDLLRYTIPQQSETMDDIEIVELTNLSLKKLNDKRKLTRTTATAESVK